MDTGMRNYCIDLIGGPLDGAILAMEADRDVEWLQPTFDERPSHGHYRLVGDYVRSPLDVRQGRMEFVHAPAPGPFRAFPAKVDQGGAGDSTT